MASPSIRGPWEILRWGAIICYFYHERHLATRKNHTTQRHVNNKMNTAMYLGFRYSTSLLAISANRLARRPPYQQNNGAPLRGAHPLFLLGGRLAKRVALIANDDVE